MNQHAQQQDPTLAPHPISQFAHTQFLDSSPVLGFLSLSAEMQGRQGDGHKPDEKPLLQRHHFKPMLIKND